MSHRNIIRFLVVFVVVFCSAESIASETKSASQPENASSDSARLGIPYPLYPKVLDKRPDISSPYLAGDGTEILTAVMRDDKYVLIPVTVEKGEPLHYSKRVSSVYGKDKQLFVDCGDFPTLAKTGLHADTELNGKKMITDFPVDLITYIGRPERFSGAGFMAGDEDIISVLKGDNKIVKKLGLTHPEMAKPLYNVWNMILEEIKFGKLRRFSGIQCFFYNGNKITLRAEGMKGWQVSIFQDEIQGRFDIDIQRNISAEEKSFLRDRYIHLTETQMAELEQRITRFHFSEMAPYYIMRYGFYEGHTSYRADPIAIACIFNLKSLEEIENAFQGKLYKTLITHFTD